MNQLRMTRRQLIRKLGGLALLARFGGINALSQSAPPDYKALVCIFLAGGNDGHDTVVSLTQSEFNAYKTARGSVALPDNNGAPLPVQTPDGTPYGFNPGLSAIHPRWAQGKLAVLANTGMFGAARHANAISCQFGTVADEPLFARGSDPTDAERRVLHFGRHRLGGARRRYGSSSMALPPFRREFRLRGRRCSAPET